MKYKMIWFELVVFIGTFFGGWMINYDQRLYVLNFNGKISKTLCDRIDVHNGLCCPYYKDNMCCTIDYTYCCPPDMPLIDYVGYCHRCDTPLSLQIGKHSTPGVCPGRKIINGKYSALPCPVDKPLYDYQGNCHACDETTGIYMQGLEENMCSKICPNRVITGYECVLPCPADKPLMNILGHCFACHTPYPISSENPDMCRLCPNREYKGGFCVLKNDSNAFNKGGTLW